MPDDWRDIPWHSELTDPPRESRPVFYLPILVNIGGGLAPAVLLSRMIYWSKMPITVSPERNGWFYHKLEDWMEELGISEFQLRTAREKLEERGLIEHKRAGEKGVLWFRVNKTAVNSAIEALRVAPSDLRKPQNRSCGNLRTEAAETSEQKLRKPQNRSCGNLRSLPIADSTTDSTAASTAESVAVPSPADNGAAGPEPHAAGDGADGRGADLLMELYAGAAAAVDVSTRQNDGLRHALKRSTPARVRYDIPPGMQQAIMRDCIERTGNREAAAELYTSAIAALNHCLEADEEIEDHGLWVRRYLAEHAGGRRGERSP